MHFDSGRAFSTTAIGVNVKRFAGSNCVRPREAIRVSASARGVQWAEHEDEVAHSCAGVAQKVDYIFVDLPDDLPAALRFDGLNLANRHELIVDAVSAADLTARTHGLDSSGLA
jgi:hypothetical protein